MDDKQFDADRMNALVETVGEKLGVLLGEMLGDMVAVHDPRESACAISRTLLSASMIYYLAAIGALEHPSIGATFSITVTHGMWDHMSRAVEARLSSLGTTD